MPKNRIKPKPLMFKRQMTSEDFEIIAFAALQALSFTEGWAGDAHNSGTIREDESDYFPSRKFKAEMRANLKEFNFIVLSKKEQL